MVIDVVCCAVTCSRQSLLTGFCHFLHRGSQTVCKRYSKQRKELLFLKVTGCHTFFGITTPPAAWMSEGHHQTWRSISRTCGINLFLVWIRVLALGKQRFAVRATVATHTSLPEGGRDTLRHCQIVLFECNVAAFEEHYRR